MDVEKIDSVLSSTEFPDATTGGCVSFAVALDNVVGVEYFPCAFDPYDDSKPLHCMSVISGVVFDADGAHGTDPTYVQEWWSGLKPNNFSWVVREAERGGRDPGEIMFEYLQEDYYSNIPSQRGVRNLGARDTDVQRYEQLLREALEDNN